MLVKEFLITSFIVILIPGTGVIYTVSTGLTKGARASIFAAIGCTGGIIPHLLASVFGLAALLHTSAVAFQLFKICGVLYLAYLAWSMWRESGTVELAIGQTAASYSGITTRGFLINILNPKLSVFFLAFLPQFVPVTSVSPVSHWLLLGGIFMLMTLVVFLCYGLFATQFRHYVVSSPALTRWVQRSFAGMFVALGIKLAAMER